MQGTQGMLKSPHAGDAGIVLVKLARMSGMFCERKARDVGDVLGPTCLEELLVQQNTSAVHPTGGVALALRARRHTARSWIGTPAWTLLLRGLVSTNCVRGCCTNYGS